MSTRDFKAMTEEQKLRALLVVAQSATARTEAALSDLARQNANDVSFTELALALSCVRTERFLTWEALRTELCAPCSVEMLKSVALRRKNPSKALYQRLTTSLNLYAKRDGGFTFNFASYRD